MQCLEPRALQAGRAGADAGKTPGGPLVVHHRVWQRHRLADQREGRRFRDEPDRRTQAGLPLRREVPVARRRRGAREHRRRGDGHVLLDLRWRHDPPTLARCLRRQRKRRSLERYACRQCFRGGVVRMEVVRLGAAGEHREQPHGDVRGLAGRLDHLAQNLRSGPRCFRCGQARAGREPAAALRAEGLIQGLPSKRRRRTADNLGARAAFHGPQSFRHPLAQLLF
mmetsp:Transcript_18139/g.54206  ORF Transcript_18139/g.54206 Transcript_18139/m.54206 type:complete len:225 (-) Transcript_18139:819-1493(-)